MRKGVRLIALITSIDYDSEHQLSTRWFECIYICPPAFYVCVYDTRKIRLEHNGETMPIPIATVDANTMRIRVSEVGKDVRSNYISHVFTGNEERRAVQLSKAKENAVFDNLSFPLISVIRAF